MTKLYEIVSTIIAHGALAFLGGAASYLSKEAKPTLLKIIVHGLIGSFCGVIFGLFTSCFTQSEYIRLAMAGIGGWLGREGMDWIFNTIKKVVSKRTN